MDTLCNSYEDLSNRLNQVEGGEVTGNINNLLKVTEMKWNIKHASKHFMSYHEFLSHIKKEPESWTTPEEKKVSEIVQDYTREKNARKKINDELERLEELLDETEKICQLKSKIDFELTEIGKKKKKMKILLQEYDLKYEVFTNKCRTQNEAKLTIEIQKNNIQQKLALIDVIESNRKENKQNVGEAQIRLLIMLESSFSSFSTAKKSNDFKNSSLLAVSLCEELSGVKVKQSSSNSHKLQIQYGQSNPKSEVTVETTFARQKPPYQTKLIDVKVNDCSVAVEEVASKAILSNDCASLATELQLRFAKSTTLSDEIAELRKLSAIDWIPAENKLIVIVGTYTCTLCVPDGYPNSGCVLLKDVKGMSCNLVADMKPLHDEPSLCDWVNYLEKNLVSEQE